MERTALLRHDTDEGTHFDWLLERPSGGRLITFRLTERIDAPRGGPWRGQRVEDHRPVYLDYEGALSGGRGRVHRVAEGLCRVMEETDQRLRVLVELGELRGEVVGVPARDGEWVFARCAEVSSSLPVEDAPEIERGADE